VESQINNADWNTKREIIRALVQRIEIGQANVAVFLRLRTQTRTPTMDPIIVTLSRA
jgi:hypothetical protein